MLHFIGIDPGTNGDQCPAVWAEPEAGAAGELVLQAGAPTMPCGQTKANSPLAPNEAVIRIPARMIPLIRQACDTSNKPMPDHGLTPTPGFPELLDATRTAADHLEMRDAYDESDATFQHWLRAGEVPTDPEGEYWRPSLSRVREAAQRGVRMRRLRVVSEPISDYIRFEHTCAAMNASAGEEVRWLPRRLANELLLPGNDCWIFDGRRTRFHLFDGDGRPVKNIDSTDPITATRCAAAFEAAWSRAIPHTDYTPGRTSG